jgi:hypothetical protein
MRDEERRPPVDHRDHRRARRRRSDDPRQRQLDRLDLEVVRGAERQLVLDVDRQRALDGSDVRDHGPSSSTRAAIVPAFRAAESGR